MPTTKGKVGDELDFCTDWQVVFAMALLSIVGVTGLVWWVLAFWSLLNPGVTC